MSCPLITDAFGWDFVNNRVLCDNYAQRGFIVYCPDFMNGAVPPAAKHLEVSLNVELTCRIPQKGRSLSPAVLPLFDTLLEKASWFTTIFVKPFSFLKAMYFVIPWILTCSPPKTEAGVIKYFKALRTIASSSFFLSD